MRGSIREARGLWRSFMQDTCMSPVHSFTLLRRIGRMLRRTRREPVEITRHGRRGFVLMSADHYDWLRAAAQRTHRTADAADVVIDAVERAKISV